MNNNAPAQNDPFAVLGLPVHADEAMVRARYLELVKQYPPDHEPEKFREIRYAYELASDPLVLASRLLEPSPDEPPEWTALDVLDKSPPNLSTRFLLGLGNRLNAAPLPPK